MHTKRIAVSIDGEPLLEREKPSAFADQLASSIHALDGQQTALTMTSTPTALKLDFKAAERVPDCLRYRYTYRAGFKPVGESVVFRNQAFPKGTAEFEAGPYIAVLLESPHIQEVLGRLPALGSTGLLIHQHLARIQRVLDDLGIRGRNIPVVLRNPVPFATSCLLNGSGKAADEWRDLIFEAFMRRPEIVNNFIQRLQANDGDTAPLAIINACTGLQRRSIRSKWTPKDLVRDVLDQQAGEGPRKQRVYRQKGSPKSRPIRLVYNSDLSLRAPARRIPIAELPHPSCWGGIEEWFPERNRSPAQAVRAS